MAGRRAEFTVSDLFPDTQAWLDAPESARRAAMNAAVAYVLKAKDQDLAAGLDRRGRPLRPISETTRRNRVSEMGPADPSAPPLMPARGASRTRLYLVGKVVGETVVCSWSNGWGEILLFHAEGRRKRDVIGLSAEGKKRARNWCLGWWIKYQRTGQLPRLAPREVQRFEPLAVRGRTDYRFATFGVQTGSGQTQERRTARGLVLQGRSTGLFQRRPGSRLTPPPGPPPAGPPPRRPPLPRPPLEPRPEPRPAAPPPGNRVSGYLAVSDQGAAGQPARDAIAAIDRVHRVGTVGRAPIVSDASIDANGRISFDAFGDPVRIAFNPTSDSPRLTVAHEIGHLIEMTGVDGKNPNRRWESDSIFAEWLKTVRESKAHAKLTERLDLYRSNPDFHDMVSHVEYLMRPDELWARSYAQFVATRSGDAAMKNDLRIRYNEQWTAADFAAIDRAIEALFRGLGWM